MRAFATPALLLVCACAAKGPKWEPLELAAIDPKAWPDAERLVLLSEQTVTFGVDPETKRAYADVLLHERVRALKAGALQRYISEEYDRTFHSRPTVWGRVIFPGGQEHPLTVDEAFDLPAWNSAVLYADTRVLSVPVPIVPKGGVLEFTTQYRVLDLKPFQFRYRLGGRDPVVLDRFRVIVPSAWELEWLTRVMGQTSPLEPAIEERPDARAYTWEARDTLPHPVEQNGINLSIELPTIITRLKKWEDQGQPQTAFASPRELSAWLFEQTKTLSAPDDAMRATAKQLLDGAPDDPFEKARRLYTHAAQKVQYCAIEVGYGGWFPHSAAQVQKSGYGDCKDKANYLKGLLSLAGIESHSTLVYSHDGHPMPFGLPSLAANFNHAILTVDLPSGPLLADPTSRTVAFGDLPISDREAAVLPIVSGGAELSIAPAAQPDDHREVERFTLAVAENGLGRGTFELEATGAIAASLRQRLVVSVPSKRREVLSDWLDMRGVTVTDVGDTRGLELQAALAVSGKVDVPRLMLGDQTARLVRLSAFAPQWLPTLSDGARRTPFVLWHRYKKVGQVKLELPASLTVKRAPPAFKRSSKWLDYSLSYEANGATLTATRELTLKERIVPLEELAALREVVEAVHLAENVAVVLVAR